MRQSSHPGSASPTQAATRNGKLRRPPLASSWSGRLASRSESLSRIALVSLFDYFVEHKSMAKSQYSWEQNAREHSEERRAIVEAIRSGQKTAWQIQEENSIFPMNSTVEIDWVDLNKRYKRVRRVLCKKSW